MGDEAVEDYKSSLADLSFNSKPLINMLTMLAEDSKHQAAMIVQVIEAHIQKAKATHKLPALYLIDSILKNVHKSNYAQLFAQNIVATFSNVFEKVDEKTRQSLFKLRQTWNNVFPARKLYALDIRVGQHDPAWPITAAPPEKQSPSIHVNPKFITKDRQENEGEKTKQDFEEAKVKQQMIEKRAELLKLQQQRLDQELAETRAKLLESQGKQPIATTKAAEKPVAIDTKKMTPSTAPLSFGVPVVQPPVTTTASGPSRRDPRLSRDPRVSRDPRMADASKANTKTSTAPQSIKIGSQAKVPPPGLTPQPPKKKPTVPSIVPKVSHVEPAVPSPTAKTSVAQSILTATVAPQTGSTASKPSQSTASTASLAPTTVSTAQTTSTSSANPVAAVVPLVTQLLTGVQAQASASGGGELPSNAINILAQLQQVLSGALQGQASAANLPVPVSQPPVMGTSQAPSQSVEASQVSGPSSFPGQPMKIPLPSQPMVPNSMMNQQVGTSQIPVPPMGMNQMSGVPMMGVSQIPVPPMPPKQMSNQPSAAKPFQGPVSKVKQSSSEPSKSPSQSTVTSEAGKGAAVPLMSIKTTNSSIPWHNPPIAHSGQIVLPPSIQELREEAEEERFSPGPAVSPRSQSPLRRDDRPPIPRPLKSKNDPRLSKSASSLQKKKDLKEDTSVGSKSSERTKRDDRERREGSKESGSGRESDRDSRGRDSEWRRRDRNTDRYSRSDRDRDRDRGRYYSSSRRRSLSPIPRRRRSRSKSRSPHSSSRSPRGDRTSKTHDRDGRSDSHRSSKSDDRRKSPKKEVKVDKKDTKDSTSKAEEKRPIKKERSSPKKEVRRKENVPKVEKKEAIVPKVEKPEEFPSMDVDLRNLKPEPVSTNEEVSMDVDLRQKVPVVEPVPSSDVDERVPVIKKEPVALPSEDQDERAFANVGNTDDAKEKVDIASDLDDRQKDVNGSLPTSDVDHRVPKLEPAELAPMDTDVPEASTKRDLDLRSPPWQKELSHLEEELDSRASTPLMDEPSEPPAKKRKSDADVEERKPSTSKEDTGDLSDLFGGEDVDYRQPPKLKLDVAAPSQSGGPLPLESPAKVGWAKFKAKHPEEFIFQQPQDLVPLTTPDSLGSADIDMRAPPAFPMRTENTTPVLEHQEAILRKAEEQLNDGKITKAQYHEILEQLGELYKLKMKHREMRMTKAAAEEIEKPIATNLPETDHDTFPPSDMDERRPFRIPKKKPEKKEDEPKKGKKKKNRKKDRKQENTEYVDDLDERSQSVLDRGMGRQEPYRLDAWKNKRYEDESTGDRDLRKNDWLKGMPLAPDGEPYDLSRDGWPLFPDGTRLGVRPDGRPDFPPPPGPSGPPPPSLMDLKIRPPPGLKDIDIDAPPQDFDERFMPPDRPMPMPDFPPDNRMEPPFGRDDDDDMRPGLRNDRPMEDNRRMDPRRDRPRDSDWRQDPQPDKRKLQLMNQMNPRPQVGNLPYVPPHIIPKMLERPVTFLDDIQEVVIDDRHFEVKIGAPARLAPFLIGGNKKVKVAVNKVKREVIIGGEPYYRIGDPPAKCQIRNHRFKLYFHGPMRRVWIDRLQYEVRLDAPPQKILIKGEPHEVRASSFDNVLIIDGISVGRLGQKPKTVKIALTKHELRFDPPPKDIVIDGEICQLKLNYPIPVIMMKGVPHGMCFDGPPKELLINDDIQVMLGMHERKLIKIGKRSHWVGFLGPGHELFIDNMTYEVQFGGAPRDITISNRIHTVRLPGPAPEVKILGKIPVDTDTGRLMFIPGEPSDYPSVTVVPEMALDSDDLRDTGMMPPPQSTMFPGQTSMLPGQQQMMSGQSMMPGQQPMMPGQQPMMPGQQPMMPGQQPMMPGQQPMMPGQQTMMPGQQTMMQPNMMAMSMAGTMATQPGQMMPGQMMPNMGQVPVSQPGFPMMQNPMMQQNPMMAQQTAMTGYMTATSQQPGMPNMNTLQNVLSSVYPQQQQQMMTNPMMMPGGVAAGTFPGMTGMQTMMQFPGMVPQQAAPQPATTAAPALDIKDLFSKLVKTGMIIQDEEKKKKEAEEKEKKRAGRELFDKDGRIIPVEIGESESLTRVEKVDDLTDLKHTKLKLHHKGVVHRLYLGLQCTSCGVRFIMEEKDKYQEHLDWHFRLNKKEKEEMKIAKFRKWYFDCQDWIDFEEIQDIEDRARKNFFARTHQAIQEAGGSIFQQQATTAQPQQTISCPAASGDTENDNLCEICGDPFEQFWDEENEEWHLKDAVRVEDKTYHPVCYEDAKLTLLTSTATPMEDGQDPFSASFSSATGGGSQPESEGTPTRDEGTPTRDEPEDNITITIQVNTEVENKTSTNEIKTEPAASAVQPESSSAGASIQDTDASSSVAETKVEPAAEVTTEPIVKVKEEPMEAVDDSGKATDQSAPASAEVIVKTEPAVEVKSEPVVEEVKPEPVKEAPKPKPIEPPFFGNAITVVGSASKSVPIVMEPFHQEPMVFNVNTLEDGEISD